MKGKVEQTSSVARARTHIERDIGQIKDFRILNFRVPLTMVLIPRRLREFVPD